MWIFCYLRVQSLALDHKVHPNGIPLDVSSSNITGYCPEEKLSRAVSFRCFRDFIGNANIAWLIHVPALLGSSTCAGRLQLNANWSHSSSSHLWMLATATIPSSSKNNHVLFKNTIWSEPSRKVLVWVAVNTMVDECRWLREIEKFFKRRSENVVSILLKNPSYCMHRTNVLYKHIVSYSLCPKSLMSSTDMPHTTPRA